ncbi:MAG TPA: PIN domain-containing protein [Rhizobiaceae bacterium]|nr:PIN domain-containing protein [Rhizobiaceae bacterium]
MNLADTSIWIDYLRDSNQSMLQPLLAQKRVVMHPFVIGEVSLGSLRNRVRIVDDMSALKRVNVATDDEAMDLITDAKLYGAGIGWVDVHLVASVLLTPGTTLLTRDSRLEAVCARLSISASAAQ